MRSTNRKRALLISGALILLCFTIIAGMTWALFSDTKKVTTHLRAGDLDLTLERVGLTKKVLNERGYLETVEFTDEEAYLDLTNATLEVNVFDFDDEEKLVPLSEYTAKLKITNNSLIAKSSVACQYWIEIVYTSEDDSAFADQIAVSINGAEAKPLKDGFTVGSETEPIGILGVNDTTAFTVTIQFLDLGTENDKSQGGAVSFDLIVHAIQYTGAEPTPTP